jgi:hypothetical protein
LTSAWFLTERNNRKPDTGRCATKSPLHPLLLSVVLLLRAVEGQQLFF